MASISNDKLSKAVELQNQFWSRIVGVFAEAAGTAMEAENAQLELITPAEIESGGDKRHLVITFAFADQPDHQQAILITEDKFSELYSVIEMEDATLDPESILSERRGQLESLVQGICLAVGDVRGEMLAATGLAIQIGQFLPPSNFQIHQEVLRSSANINCGGRSVEVVWLYDPNTLELIFTEEVAEETTFEPVVAAGAGATGQGPSDNGLDLLMDIPLEISVELGRMRMLVKDVIELGAGSIVEIDKAAGEPVDVLVNGRPVARGEVVVIEDNFGVRITEILNPKERIARLSDAA